MVQRDMLSKVVLSIYRLAYWFNHKQIPVVPNILVLFIRLVFSCKIGLGAKIGKAVYLGGGGLSIIIHGRAVIGKNTRIGSSVTIGGTSKKYQVPIIGKNVVIGNGAIIVGPVKVGDCSVIGANSVVTEDIPKNCIAAGVPAKVVKVDINIADYHDGITEVVSQSNV